MLSAFSSIVDFGIQDINVASGVTSVAFVATGTNAVTISGVSVTGANAADFQLSGSGANSCSGGVGGGTCYLNLQFTPSVVGVESATLTVTSDSAGGPVMVTLVGIGQTAAKSLVSNTDYLDLGALKIGTTSSSSVLTFTNTGDDVLTIQYPSISGPNAANFAVTSNTCYSGLAAGASCAVYISFTPSVAGTATATLSVASNAANSPITVGVAGTGTVNP
jgi:hypothetical protein